MDGALASLSALASECGVSEEEIKKAEAEKEAVSTDEILKHAREGEEEGPTVIEIGGGSGVGNDDVEDAKRGGRGATYMKVASDCDDTLLLDNSSAAGHSGADAQSNDALNADPIESCSS